jgi:minor extracellular serine protease Vpr
MKIVNGVVDRVPSGRGWSGPARRLGALAGALWAAAALAQAGGVAQVQPDVAAEVVAPSGPVDESPSLWYVELAGAPTADGGSSAALATAHRTFRDAAKAAGVPYLVRQEFSALFNGFSVAVSPRNLGKLRGLGGVVALHPVFEVTRPDGAPSGADLFTALGMTGADVAHSSLGLTGRGVRVAVVDTGVDYDNADLGGDGVPRANSTMFPNRRVVKGWDFVGDAYNADPASAAYNVTLAPDAYPDDCAGHGTHVAGIVGANGLVTGVAPDVMLHAYRVFGCAGSTNDDVILAALERALKDKVDVVNMSLGSPFGWPQSPTAKAATRLAKKGIVVVASAGNNGDLGLYATGGPSAGVDALSVASIDNVGVYIDYLLAGGKPFGWLPARRCSSAAAPAAST